MDNRLLMWENVSWEAQATWAKLLKQCCWRNTTENPRLNNLFGSVGKGDLVALMGPSGAGKSTLFNCLGNGKYKAEFDGNIYVRTNRPIEASYLTQTAEDHLLMNLTVVESLRYASKLKNQHFANWNEHEQVVSDLLQELNLMEVKENLAEQCSGGQRKRLAIGLELVAENKPQFLILDEPLSGLDSCSGLEILQLLKGIAVSNFMSVILTIHQPSFEILEVFDHAYIISKHGQCIYNGPPREMTSFLTAHHYASRDNDNPADSIIKIAYSVGTALDTDDVELGHANGPLPEHNPDPPTLPQICSAMAATISRNVNGPRDDSWHDMSQSGICKNNAKFTWFGLWTLFLRSTFTSIVYQKKLLLVRAALHIVVAMVLAGLYSRDIGLNAACFTPNGTDPKNCSCIPTNEELQTEDITTQNVKFQFFSLLFLMFAALMPTVLTFPAEIKLFLNEHRNGWYTTTSYYISKTIVEIPVQVIYCFLYTLFLYWYSQQADVQTDPIWYFCYRFWNFFMVTCCSCFIAQGLGFLIGILCVRSFDMSVIVSSALLLFLFLFSGFFVKVVRMAASVKWITY